MASGEYESSSLKVNWLMMLSLGKVSFPWKVIGPKLYTSPRVAVIVMIMRLFCCRFTHVDIYGGIGIPFVLQVADDPKAVLLHRIFVICTFSGIPACQEEVCFRDHVIADLVFFFFAKVYKNDLFDMSCPAFFHADLNVDGIGDRILYGVVVESGLEKSIFNVVRLELMERGIEGLSIEDRTRFYSQFLL